MKPEHYCTTNNDLCSGVCAGSVPPGERGRQGPGRGLQADGQPRGGRLKTTEKRNGQRRRERDVNSQRESDEINRDEKKRHFYLYREKVSDFPF